MHKNISFQIIFPHTKKITVTKNKNKNLELIQSKVKKLVFSIKILQQQIIILTVFHQNSQTYEKFIIY